MDVDLLTRMVSYGGIGCLVVEGLVRVENRSTSACCISYDKVWRKRQHNYTFVLSLVLTKRWLSWLSSVNKTGRSLDHLVDFVKCCMNTTVFSEVIHPFAWRLQLSVEVPMYAIINL